MRRNGPRINLGPGGPSCLGADSMIDGPGAGAKSSDIELQVSIM